LKKPPSSYRTSWTEKTNKEPWSERRGVSKVQRTTILEEKLDLKLKNLPRINEKSKTASTEN